MTIDGRLLKEKRILDPLERASEILFGLIMVLSFTGSLSVATSGSEEVRTVLIGAIGCNLAWGLVDAVMYVFTSLTESGRIASFLNEVRGHKQLPDAQKLVSEILPPEVSGSVTPDVLGRIVSNIRGSTVPIAKPKLTGNVWRGALGVFLLVFLSTFPVVLPFLFSDTLFVAMRWSNGIALIMMFATGYSTGKYGGFSPVRAGLSMVALGVFLVAITIALGG